MTSKPATQQAHHVLALIVTAVSGVQVIIAHMGRPLRGAPLRNLWNQVHSWSGRVCMAAALACVITGCFVFRENRGERLGKWLVPAILLPGVFLVLDGLLSYQRSAAAEDAAARAAAAQTKGGAAAHKGGEQQFSGKSFGLAHNNKVSHDTADSHDQAAVVARVVEKTAGLKTVSFTSQPSVLSLNSQSTIGYGYGYYPASAIQLPSVPALPAPPAASCMDCMPGCVPSVAPPAPASASTGAIQYAKSGASFVPATTPGTRLTVHMVLAHQKSMRQGAATQAVVAPSAPSAPSIVYQPGRQQQYDSMPRQHGANTQQNPW